MVPLTSGSPACWHKVNLRLCQDIRKEQNLFGVGEMGKEWKKSTDSKSLDVAFWTCLIHVRDCSPALA